jgi:hypothetical protein
MLSQLNAGVRQHRIASGEKPVDDKYFTPWEGLGILIVFGGPLYAFAAQRTYAALVRRGSVWPGRRAVVAATLLTATVVALPIQLLVW